MSTGYSTLKLKKINNYAINKSGSRLNPLFYLFVFINHLIINIKAFRVFNLCLFDWIITKHHIAEPIFIKFKNNNRGIRP